MSRTVGGWFEAALAPLASPPPTGRLPASKLPTTGRRSVVAKALSCALGLLALHGCSLQVTRPSSCTTNAECRSAFGLGSTCEPTAGLCSAPAQHPRCSLTVPSDLFTNLETQRNSIILGSIYDYTAHQDSQRATELAVLQANQNGGLDGKRFAIVHCDYAANAGDMRTDVQATESIVDYLSGTLEVPAIIGPRGSARAVAAFNRIKMLRAAGKPGSVLISPSATSPELTALDNPMPTDANPGFLWRTVPPDTLQAEVIARDMTDRMVRRVTVIFQRGAYGEGLSQLFNARFGATGAVTLLPFDSGALGDVIAAVGASDAEEVLFISSNIADVVGFVNGTAASSGLAMQYATKRLFLTDTAYNQMLIDMATPAARGIFERTRGTRPASAEGTPLFNAFAADFMVQYRAAASASGFTAHSYDAAWLALYGAAWSQFNAGGVSPLGIAQGLRHVSMGRPVEIRPVNWMAVQDAFRAGMGVDVAGASGSLQYDPATEETTAPIEVWQFTAGSMPDSYMLTRAYVYPP